MRVPPSHEYRDYLRGVRLFLDPDTEALLMGTLVNNLWMQDLEALFELVMGVDPRPLAPPDYHPHHV